MNVSAKPSTAEVEIHGNFVDGREIEAGQRRDARRPQSRHRRRDRADSEFDRRGYRSRHEKRACRVRRQGLGRHGCPFAGAAGQPAGGRVRGEPGIAVPAGDLEQRPAAQRDPRAAVAAAGLLPLFRRPCAGAPRFRDPGRRLLFELYPAHADRHRRQLHAVQSSADDHVQVAGGRPGERLRHGGKAVGIYAADDLAAGADFQPRRDCRPACSMSCSGLARAPAGCSPSMAISTSWC